MGVKGKRVDLCAIFHGRINIVSWISICTVSGHFGDLHGICDACKRKSQEMWDNGNISKTIEKNGEFSHIGHYCTVWEKEKVKSTLERRRERLCIWIVLVSTCLSGEGSTNHHHHYQTTNTFIYITAHKYIYAYILRGLTIRLGTQNSPRNLGVMRDLNKSPCFLSTFTDVEKVEYHWLLLTLTILLFCKCTDYQWKLKSTKFHSESLCLPDWGTLLFW